MGAQMQRGPHHDLIEQRSGGVDDELRSAGGANNAAQIARIHRGDGNEAFFPEEAAGAVRVAVATPDRVALAFEKLREEGTGRSGP